MFGNFPIHTSTYVYVSLHHLGGRQCKSNDLGSRQRRRHRVNFACRYIRTRSPPSQAACRWQVEDASEALVGNPWPPGYCMTRAPRDNGTSWKRRVSPAGTINITTRIDPAPGPDGTYSHCAAADSICDRQQCLALWRSKTDTSALRAHTPRDVHFSRRWWTG